MSDSQSHFRTTEIGDFGALKHVTMKSPAMVARADASISVPNQARGLEKVPVVIRMHVEEPLDAYGETDEIESSVITAMLRKNRLPPFQFDCGVDDPLIEGNRRLYSQLQEAGIDCSYQEFPGGHEWPYWISHVRETFRFFDLA